MICVRRVRVPDATPGPGVNYGLTYGQVPVYNGQTSGNSVKWLPVYIHSYLTLPEPRTIGIVSNFVVQVFVCPAWTSLWAPGNIDSASSLTDPSQDNYQSYATTWQCDGILCSKHWHGGQTGRKHLLDAAFPAGNKMGTGGSQLGPEPFGKQGSGGHEPLSLSLIRRAGVSPSGSVGHWRR